MRTVPTTLSLNLSLAVVSALANYSCCKKDGDRSDNSIPVDQFVWRMDGAPREVRSNEAVVLTEDFGMHGWPVSIGRGGGFPPFPGDTQSDTLEIGKNPGVHSFFIDTTGADFISHPGGGNPPILQFRDNAFARGAIQRNVSYALPFVLVWLPAFMAAFMGAFSEMELVHMGVYL